MNHHIVTSRMCKYSIRMSISFTFYFIINIILKYYWFPLINCFCQNF